MKQIFSIFLSAIMIFSCSVNILAQDLNHLFHKNIQNRLYCYNNPGLDNKLNTPKVYSDRYNFPEGIVVYFGESLGGLVGPVIAGVDILSGGRKKKSAENPATGCINFMYYYYVGLFVFYGAFVGAPATIPYGVYQIGKECPGATSYLSALIGSLSGIGIYYLSLGGTRDANLTSIYLSSIVGSVIGFNVIPIKRF
jgi:hypothetical protein